jgi:hypothetical protein
MTLPLTRFGSFLLAGDMSSSIGVVCHRSPVGDHGGTASRHTRGRCSSSNRLLSGLYDTDLRGPALPAAYSDELLLVEHWLAVPAVAHERAIEPGAVVEHRGIEVLQTRVNDSALEVIARQTTEGEFEHIFINRDTSKPYTTIAKVWERLRKTAGLPDLRLHDLRHSFASFLVNSGRTLYEVQQILGHSDAKVTERYAHLSRKTLQEAANSASLAIKGAEPKAA